MVYPEHRARAVEKDTPRRFIGRCCHGRTPVDGQLDRHHVDLMARLSGDIERRTLAILHHGQLSTLARPAICAVPSFTAMVATNVPGWGKENPVQR